MSNFRAIATVSATLKELLLASINKDGLNTVGGGDIISVMRPDMAAKNFQGVGVNIYLYQVTPNAALRNCDLPTRRADGTVVQRPVAALDLHYMISFYSTQDEFVPQLLLASVARTLQAEPQLTRDRIRSTIINGLYSGFLNVAGSPSNLADQVELVKFNPLHLSLEELAKIWSVFYQIPYVLSVAYQGTAVLIESDDTPQNALPVQVRNTYAVPFNQPVIEEVGVKADVNQTIVAGKPVTLNDTLRILGKRLQGISGTLVQIGGVEMIPGIANVNDTQIDLPLNAAFTLSDGTSVSPRDKLRAGVQGLQVIQRRKMGMDEKDKPQNWHRGVESNVAAFVLRPVLTNPLSNVPGVVTAIVSPLISRKQRIILLLNELDTQPSQSPALQPRSRSYSFVADPKDQTWRDQDGNVVTDPGKFSGEDTTDTIKFSISGVAPGPAKYLIRVQVDGAESLLDTDTNPKSTTFNLYSGTPQVTI